MNEKKEMTPFEKYRYYMKLNDKYVTEAIRCYQEGEIYKSAHYKEIANGYKAMAMNTAINA